jgi:hypothetical protein
MKTITEFENWYKKAREDDDEQLPFVWELMRSPYTEYHYSLIISENTSDEFRGNLWHRFDMHGEEAAQLLLSKLDHDEDIDFHADILFCLGTIADKKKGEIKEKVLAHARKSTDSANDYVRNRAIIVLGWIGTVADIPLLAGHLLNDTDDKCRTWSATSFMQMWFRRKSQTLVDKVLPYLWQAIQQEKDYFALGCMMDVVQTLTGKRFALAQKSIDNIDKEKIDAAKVKVERYFKKLYAQP